MILEIRCGANVSGLLCTLRLDANTGVSTPLLYLNLYFGPLFAKIDLWTLKLSSPGSLSPILQFAGRRCAIWPTRLPTRLLPSGPAFPTKE